MPALIPVQYLTQYSTQTHFQQVSSKISPSDSEKELDIQILLVKQIRAKLGTEMTKLEMMEKQLQLRNINEIKYQEMMKKKQIETGDINRTEMEIMKQQHQRGITIRTEMMMKKQQPETGNINHPDMMMMMNIKYPTRNIHTTEMIKKQRHQTGNVHMTEKTKPVMMKKHHQKENTNRSETIKKRQHVIENITRTGMMMKQHNTENNKRKDPLKNEESHEKRLRLSSPSSINGTIRENESKTDVEETNDQISASKCQNEKSVLINCTSEGGSTRRNQKEPEVFRNCWSVVNDMHEDDDIDSEEDNATINIEEVVEQEVNKRRMEDRNKMQ